MNERVQYPKKEFRGIYGLGDMDLGSGPQPIL